MKKLLILFLLFSTNLFGQVTYIGLRMPSVFTISGSPITSQGNFIVTFANDQTASRVLATPVGTIGALGLRLIKNGHIDASAAISASKLQSTVMVEGENISLLANNSNFMIATNFPDSITAHTELVTSTSNFDKLNDVLAMTEENGDILYYNYGWTRLSKGSNGQVLKLASGLPAWGTDASGVGGSNYADSLTINSIRKAGEDLFNSQYDAKKASNSDSLGALPASNYLEWGDTTAAIASQYDISGFGTGDFLKIWFGDSLVNYDGYGVIITNNDVINVDTSQVATQYDLTQISGTGISLSAFGDSMNIYRTAYKWDTTKIDTAQYGKFVRDHQSSGNGGDFSAASFGDSLINYDGDGIKITDNDAIDLLLETDKGLQIVSDSLGIKLDGSTLSLSSLGIKVNDVSGITGANEDDVTLTDVQIATSSDFHNIGGTDDDVPESGDFGAATDLDANGALNANSVLENEINWGGINQDSLQSRIDSTNFATRYWSGQQGYMIATNFPDSINAHTEIIKFSDTTNTVATKNDTISTLATQYDINDMATQTWTNAQGFLTGNETITLSGDVSGSGATAITTAIGIDKVKDTMVDWGTGVNQVSGADVPIEKISTSTYGNIQDWVNTIQSAGKISGGVITDDGDGTITVSAGTGFIKTTDSDIATTKFLDWSASTSLSLTDNSANYIYVDYNAGSPVLAVATTIPTDKNTKIVLGMLYKEGTDIHVVTAGQAISNFAKKVIWKSIEINGKFQRSSGIIISELSNRGFTLTAGAVYAGITKTILSAFSTSSDSFIYYSRDGAGDWTKVTEQTQIDNTHYDDNSGTLATLSNGGWGGSDKYGVHWVYEDIDNDVFVVYGQGDYTLSEAQDAQPPSSIPDLLTNVSGLVGKIIIQKSDNSFTIIQSAFDVTFSPTGVNVHNDLANIQGGAADEYYHLTLNQLNKVTSTANYINFTIDYPIGLIADTCWFWENQTGASVNIDSIHVETDYDNFDVLFVRKDWGGGNVAFIDSVITNISGVNCYYKTETTITAATVATSKKIGFVRPTDTASYMLVRISYH